MFLGYSAAAKAAKYGMCNLDHRQNLGRYMLRYKYTKTVYLCPLLAIGVPGGAGLGPGAGGLEGAGVVPGAGAGGGSLKATKLCINCKLF